ncbi:MAG: tetratricopeptide repeat protein [Spirochaetaceae bacterium]|nr:MAG: tetratricopeptide repeat protein [Spirochaetaceae bacterium]
MFFVALLFFVAGAAFSIDPDSDRIRELAAMPIDEVIPALERIEFSEKLAHVYILAVIAAREADTQRARRLFDYGRETAEENGDSASSGEFSYSLGVLDHESGRFDDAISSFHDASRAFDEAGLQSAAVRALLVVGNIHHRIGRLKAAIDVLDQVIAREAEIEDRLVFAEALSESAMVRYKYGELADVPSLLDRALPIYLENEHLDGVGTVHRIRGNYYAALGDADAALGQYLISRESYRETGNAHDFANTSFNIALMHANRGELTEAVDFFENALENFALAGSLTGAGMAGTELARVLHRMGRLDEAERFVRQAIEHLRAGSSNRRLAQAYVVLGEIGERRGRPDEAIAAYRQAVTIYREIELDAHALPVMRALERLEHASGGT